MHGTKVALFALALANPASALAISLTLAGDFSGQINGEPIAGTVTGQLDTTGASASRAEFSFLALPPGHSPVISHGSMASAGCTAVLQPVDGASNLFDLSGGNYSAIRTVTWPSLPGDQLVNTIDVSNDAGVLSSNTEINGTYSGPTDFVLAIDDYTTLWTQIDDTSIRVDASYSVQRASGAPFAVRITTLFTGLSNPMPVAQQQGTATFSNVSFEDGVFAYDWAGTIAPVPEPATDALLGVGVLALLAGRYSVQAKRVPSAEV